MKTQIKYLFLEVILLIMGLQTVIAQDVNREEEVDEIELLSDDRINVSGLTMSGCPEFYKEIPHSQKTLTWANGQGGKKEAKYYSLTLSRFEHGDKEISRLVAYKESAADYSGTGDYLLNRGGLTFSKIFPDTIDIYDIKVFDDVVYFCGRIISRKYYSPSQITPNILHYEMYDTSGVVGWIQANSLFSPESAAISYVKSGYVYTKLRVFKDIGDHFITKVAAMGTYRNPSYMTAQENNPFNPGPTIWIENPPTYNDMVFIYNTSGLSSYVKSPHNTNKEKFQDIKLIGGDIAILSLMYEDNLSDNLYTPSGELTSEKVRYRAVKALDLTQTNSYFDIKWIDYVTTQEYDANIPKGIYNARLDYAGEFDGFYTNLNSNNRTGNLIGFGIDDDLPAYGYDNYDSCKLPYQYNLVMSFNHYESRPDSNYYAVIMNWVSHNELIHANNNSYMGAKCSARIYESSTERKLIDVNRMVGNIYPRLTEYPTQGQINSTAFSDYNVILEEKDKLDYIYVVHLDDHTTDSECFWTNTSNASSSHNENNYIHGGRRIGYEIKPDNNLFDIPGFPLFNDINTIKGQNHYLFRTVGNIGEPFLTPRVLSFFQYSNVLNQGVPCYTETPFYYYERAYPVKINYVDIPDLNTYIYNTNLNVTIIGINGPECLLNGDCKNKYLK